MPVPVRDRLQQRLPELGFYNCFGQSEIGPLATVLRPEEHAERPESVRPAGALRRGPRRRRRGRRRRRPASPASCSTARPSCAPATGTSRTRRPRPSATGGSTPATSSRATRPGYLTVVDRIKDVINTGGVLVASREVEDALYTHPAVAEVAVIATPHERWIEAVTAVVVLRAGQTVTESELIDHARATLAPFKLPKAIHFVDELPRNQSGKLLKRVLRDDLARQAAPR